MIDWDEGLIGLKDPVRLVGRVALWQCIIFWNVIEP